jgi:translation elongation factor EF-G
MKNKDLFRILEGINSCGNLRGAKFSHALSKNKARLESEIKHIQKGLIPSKEYESYEKKRLELCTKFSKKDKKNNPIIEKDTFAIDDREKFDIELEKLKDEYKNLLEDRELQIEDYKKHLEDDVVNFNFHKLSIKSIPDDITVKQMEMIIEMVEDKE